MTAYFGSDISRFTPIKQQLPDYISFDHIKIVLSILKKQYGLTNSTILADNTLQDMGQPTTNQNGASVSSPANQRSQSFVGQINYVRLFNYELTVGVSYYVRTANI